MADLAQTKMLILQQAQKVMTAKRSFLKQLTNTFTKLGALDAIKQFDTKKEEV